MGPGAPGRGSVEPHGSAQAAKASSSRKAPEGKAEQYHRSPGPGSRGRLVPACPSPPTSHSPAAAQPEPADPAREVQEDGQASGAGGGRGGVRSVRPAAGVCRAPAVGRALLDSLAPSTGWTRAWKSSEGPGGQTLTGTGRGLWRAQEPLSLARLSVGTWSAAPRLREASGLGPPPTAPSLLVIFPMFIETPSSEASLAIPPRGSWASSTQAGRSFTPECSQHPAGGSWPVLQARGPRAACQGSAWAEGNLVHA